MYRINSKTLLLASGLILSASTHAETLPIQVGDIQINRGKQAPPAPLGSYNYAYPVPGFHRPYYPLHRPRFSNRNAHRYNGRNGWFGDNRMRHWNRVVSDMVSDMFGDGAGDFEFDMKIKFKADGKGKGKTSGRGKSYANSRTQQRYSGDYRGNYRARGDYIGRTHSYHGSPYRGYAFYPYVPPYVPYNTYQKNITQQPATYPSYPPVTSTRKESSNSENGK